MSDINAIVGRKIGLEPTKLYGQSGEPLEIEIWPDFEHDWAAAELLVKWMHMQGWYFHLSIPPAKDTWGPSAEFTKYNWEVWRKNHENPATAITHAFCAANGITI